MPQFPAVATAQVAGLVAQHWGLHLTDLQPQQAYDRVWVARHGEHMCAQLG